VSRAFDLTWFFGGGVLSLVVLALYFAAGAPIVALWWIWLLAFDGPHIGAAFTRTYFDAEEWRRRPALLLTSLITFAAQMSSSRLRRSSTHENNCRAFANGFSPTSSAVCSRAAASSPRPLPSSARARALSRTRSLQSNRVGPNCSSS